MILEQAQAMPKQGVASTYNFGRGFGIWLGILGALEIPYRTVRPSQGRKDLQWAPRKGKERSVQFARRMFSRPRTGPTGCRKPRDGRATPPVWPITGWWRDTWKNSNLPAGRGRP